MKRRIYWSGVLGLLSATAQAQSTDEVMVQSGRMLQRQLDAPASVHLIDGDAIRNAGPQVNLSEALSQVPGVVALNRNNYAQDVQISIRGFGARAPFGLRGIRLITDGIPATIPDGQGQASTVSLTSAERIEVLTGPLAQLYGNSAGGVIQTTTREAGAQPQADAQATFGSYGLRRTDWQASGRAGSVGLVADYSTFQTDGYRANSAAERKQFNGVLTADLQEGTRLKLIANAFDMPYAMDPLGLTAAQLSADPQQAGSNALANRTRKIVSQNQLGAVLEHRFSDALRLQARAYTGTRDNLQYQASSATAGTWVGLAREFKGVGLQINGKARTEAGDKIDWVVGVDADQSGEQRQGGATAAGEKTGAITRNEYNEASNRDLFGQLNWHLPNLGGSPWTLTAGLRRSSVDLKSRDDMPVTNTDPNGSGAVNYTATSPVLGATWHASEQLNVYANWGRGFETPTLAEAAYAVAGTGNTRSVVGQFNPNLLASQSQHKEVGIKWTPTRDMRLDAAVFHIQTEREIVTALSDAGKTAYTNAAQTLRQGVELSWRAKLAEQWRAQLSATWLEATYDSAFTTTAKTGSTYTSKTVPAGKAMPGIPEQQLFASVQWAAQGFGAKAPLGMQASLDWVARSRIWASDANDLAASAAGYGLLNAKVRQRYQVGPGRVEVYAGVDNLLGRRYVGSLIVNQASAQFFEPGLPRNAMIGVKASLPL
jgi:iron complex outermembrane receptor protein